MEDILRNFNSFTLCCDSMPGRRTSMTSRPAMFAQEKWPFYQLLDQHRLLKIQSERYHLDSIENTPPTAEILCVKNGRAIVVCGFLMKSLKKYILKI